MMVRLYIDLGLPEPASALLENAGPAGESLATVNAYNRMKLHLYRGEIDEAARLCASAFAIDRPRQPRIFLLMAPSSNPRFATTLIEADIELLESILEQTNIPVEYSDGFILSRTAAILAPSLAELHFEAGNQAFAVMRSSPVRSPISSARSPMTRYGGHPMPGPTPPHWPNPALSPAQCWSSNMCRVAIPPKRLVSSRATRYLETSQATVASNRSSTTVSK